MGQLELPFRGLFVASSESSTAGTFAPGSALSLLSVFAGGSKSSMERKF